MHKLRSRLSRRTRHIISVGVAFTVAMIAAANIANAQTSTTQAADTAVQIFAQFGAVAGLPIDPSEVTAVQGIVNCAISGTAVGTCAENTVVSAVLGEVASSLGSSQVGDIATSAVNCLNGGAAIGSCLTQSAVDQLPPEAQPLANCVLGGGNLGDCVVKSTEGLIVQQLSQAAGPDASSAVGAIMNCVAGQTAVAKCAAQQLANSLPDSMKPFATCLSQGGTMQSCAANLAAGAVGQNSPQAAALVACLGNTDGNAMQQCAAKAGLSAANAAAGQAVQQAVGVISTLNVNAAATDPSGFPKQPAVLQNVIMLAQGIQTGNWTEMAAGAGSQIVEVASQIILDVFVSPQIADILAPVVNAMIQNDANAALAALGDLQQGDVVGLAQTAFTWAATTLFSPECALFTGGVATDICNGLAGAVQDVSNFGGGILKDALGVAKDILGSIGLWNPVDSVVSGAFDDVKDAIDDVFKGPTHSCSTTAASLQNYFNANFLICARNIADNRVRRT